MRVALLKWIVSEYAVIRPQSAASANGVSSFPHGDYGASEKISLLRVMSNDTGLATVRVDCLRHGFHPNSARTEGGRDANYRFSLRWQHFFLFRSGVENPQQPFANEPVESLLALWGFINRNPRFVPMVPDNSVCQGLPGQPAEMPNEPRLPPNRGHGDLRLTQECGWHMVLRKDKVEIGNSGQNDVASARPTLDAN